MFKENPQLSQLPGGPKQFLYVQTHSPKIIKFIKKNLK